MFSSLPAEPQKIGHLNCVLTYILYQHSWSSRSGEGWNCPLGSFLICSDCAYITYPVGNGGQALLQAVKQSCVWLKTTLSWNINIPAGPRHALGSNCFTSNRDWAEWVSHLVKMEENGIVLWPGRNDGNVTCMCFLKGETVWVLWHRLSRESCADLFHILKKNSSLTQVGP